MLTRNRLPRESGGVKSTVMGVLAADPETGVQSRETQEEATRAWALKDKHSAPGQGGSRLMQAAGQARARPQKAWQVGDK